jgi:CheY-like chemotaxis protein
VILHGGGVEALSGGPGQGSEFVVWLPRIEKASTPAGTAPEPADQAAEQAPMRVLIVDDNVDAAAMLATLLELDGHEVSVEHEGRSGLQRARLDRPQVLLLDIGLPDMDGYQLAREVRKLPDLAGAVLVALTGYGQGQDRLEAERSGFDHHLVKPASMERISEILAQAREHVREAG